MRLILASVLVLAATGSALADGDVAKGETQFKKCMACHAIGPDAKVKVGPPLNGIVGAKWAHFEGYAYSQDIKDGAAAGKVWDLATLDDYIENPKHLVPKGKMAFAGIKNADDRKDLIAYLATFDADGKPAAK
ncbi:cytochrome c family protein [Xanthobacter autotrophicus DSM 431]|uniref:c-type cytochrome n=1 Tax=Xanthobacter nonsaccharivorans TaxID=3119912 RepID=UPI0037270914